MTDYLVSIAKFDDDTHLLETLRTIYVLQLSHPDPDAPKIYEVLCGQATPPIVVQEQMEGIAHLMSRVLSAVRE